MASFYVRTNGADGTGGHDGTTPALAWLTPAYAVTHVSAGDTIWVGAGVYRTSTGVAPSSMASMTYLYGDTDGSHTGDAGEVKLTAFATNDTTAPTAVTLLNLASKNFWTVGGFTIMCGGAVGISISGTTHDIVLQDLTIFGGKGFQPISTPSYTWGQAMNLTIQRCRVWSQSAAGINLVNLPASATGADQNQNILVQNRIVLCFGAAAVFISAAANTKHSGGVRIYNCFLFGSTAVDATDVDLSTTYLTTVYNCFLGGTGTGVNGNATAKPVEDYNYIVSATGVANVNAGSQGAHTITDGSYDWTFMWGQEFVFGARPRPFGMWPAGSPMLGWGTAGVTVTDDLLGAVRPGSGAATVAKALGPMERSNSWVKETGTVRTGSNAISCAGPGYQDFSLPVDAASTTVTIYLRYDSTYAGTLPSLNVLNGGECGVANASQAQVGAANTWEQRTLTFTPTSAGIVTIRLLSSDTNGGGKAFADDFAVA